MAYQERRPQRTPPITEQEIDFEFESLQSPLFNSNSPPAAGPALAPGNASTAGYPGGGMLPHGYSGGPSGGTQFTSASAFGPGQPAGLPLQNWYPQGYTQMPWPPTWPPAPQFPNISSPLAHHPLATAQAAPLGQFQGSHGFLNTFSPTALHPAQGFGLTSHMAPGPPQQPRAQVVSQSAPRHHRFQARVRRKLQSLRISTPKDSNACWKCRNDHKPCSPGTPCDECARKPPSASAISCHRGPVCDVAAEIPFACHVPRGARRLPPSLPEDLQRADNHLSQLKQLRRQRQSVYRHKAPHNEAECRHRVFCTIINTKVEGIRYNLTEKAFEDTGVAANQSTLSLPYDDLIADLVWELEDNPNAAELTGIGTVEDFVALLEAACVCEAQSGLRDETKRLVYNSLRCLSYGLEALQLAAGGMLATDPHTHCAEADQCISPALYGLTRYAHQFTEAMTIALFHKHRAGHQNWLLIFYSLCIQSHIRRIFMSLEQHQRSTQAALTTGDMEVDGYVQPLCSAKYLHTAVSLFGQISMQGKGKLANMILGSRLKPSVYLQKLASHPARAGSASRGTGGGSTWQKGGTEGVIKFLARAFQLDADGRPGSGSDSDSGATIRNATASLSPAAAPETAMGAAMAVAATPISAAAQGHGATGDADGEAWVALSPTGTCPREPSIDTMWSETSYGEGSDVSTVYAGSFTSSSASCFESFAYSMESLSTIPPRDNEGGDIFWPPFQPPS